MALGGETDEKGEGEEAVSNNKWAPPRPRVAVYPRNERAPQPRVDATAGGEQGDRPIAVQGCDDRRGIGTPRLSDFPPACQRLASGYALGLVHGHK